MNGALREPERHQFLAERSAGAIGPAKPWLFRPDWKKGLGYVILSSSPRRKPMPAATAAFRLGKQAGESPGSSDQLCHPTDRPRDRSAT
jgi:hypothetical protein